MDATAALAHALHSLFRLLRVVRFGPAIAMSPGELRGAAHLLATGILGTLWDRRRGAPAWDTLSQGWEAAVRPGTVDPALYGALDPADQVRLLADNAEAFAVRAELLDGARETVDLATYYVQGDATGLQTVAALEAAARRGVRVRVLADEYVMEKKEFESLGTRALVARLRSAGISVSLWRDRARPFDAQHRKLLVVDGEHVILGGRNYADHYAGPEWRDTELYLRGPSARAAVGVFERSLALGPEPQAVQGQLFHATEPATLSANPNFRFLLSAVGAATRSVVIENAYYFSHSAVLGALRAAVGRGVRVQVLTNSAESNDLDFANWRLYHGFGPMLDAGIELYLRPGKGRTVHSKYFVADGEWVSLGSSNLDYYSPRHCRECNLHVRSAALGQLLEARFESGRVEAERVSDPAAITDRMAGMGISRAVDRFLRDYQ